MPPGSVQHDVVAPRSILTNADREPHKDNIGEDNTSAGIAPDGTIVAPKKVKKVRLLLDVRTELTDDELKVSFMYRWHTNRHDLSFRLQEKGIQKDSALYVLSWKGKGTRRKVKRHWKI